MQISGMSPMFSGKKRAVKSQPVEPLRQVPPGKDYLVTFKRDPNEPEPKGRREVVTMTEAKAQAFLTAFREALRQAKLDFNKEVVGHGDGLGGVLTIRCSDKAAQIMRQHPMVDICVEDGNDIRLF